MFQYSAIIADHIEGVDRGSAWQSHTEWNDQSCLGESATTTCLLLSGESCLHSSNDHISFATAQYKSQFHSGFLFLFYGISSFDCVMECLCCLLCKFYYNAYIFMETDIIYLGCAPNIVFNFNWYCMLQ